MEDMAQGKRHTPPSDNDKRELANMLTVLKDRGWTPETIGAHLGMTGAGVRKWDRYLSVGPESGSFPSGHKLNALRTLAQSVAHRVSGPTTEMQPTVALTSTTVQPGVTFRPTPIGLVAVGPEKGEALGEVIRMRPSEMEGVRYPELELCLWYNRAEIAGGMVGYEVIEGARRGRFEPAGCADWDGPRWWKELLEAEERFAKSTFPTSGTHKTPSKPPKKPTKK